MPGAPRVYKTEAIILRRRNLGEADSVFTLISPKLGKFDAIAKGVRKARSKMRGHLEPLTCCNVMLARGRSLDVFTQAETVNPFRSLREDLDRGATAMYCAELAERFAAEHEENPELYGLLGATFAALDSGAPLHVTRWFELAVLGHSGYAFQLDSCALCAARLPEMETLFSAVAGGLVCADCRPAASTGRLLSVRAVKVLRFARAAELDRFAALRLDETLDHELRAVAQDAVRHVLDRDPRSARFVDEVRNLPPRVGREPGDPERL